LDASRSTYDRLLNRISTRSAQVGVIGLGYVGLPLAFAIARAGFPVAGFDIEAHKVESLNNGQSYIEAVTSTALAGQVASGRFRATADFAELAVCDVIIICVPTPLTKHREPDLSFVRNTAGTIAKYLRLGQLIVLESTTYPGTTDDVIKPILEETGLQSKIDFFLGFSPEREDPGNRSFEVATIPKVVAGDGIEAATLVQAFYQGVVKTVVPVSTTATAEAVKLTENIFRSVNIALVNELKVVLGAMGIDIWEVIEAAKSKPFGYMPFYPGPGLGGHCVPIDPFYLTWKAREYDFYTEFIELAGKVNENMPYWCQAKLARALNSHERAVRGASILLLGVAYKADIGDMRESPALKLIELLREDGANVAYHDPHVSALPELGLTSAPLEPGRYDCVAVVTAHSSVDYAEVVRQARLVVDFRNATRGVEAEEGKVWKL
jgi:UDP-N-acetyl-D-glucosamine dehydrogenase